MTVQKVVNVEKDIQTKIAKKLLDMIILQLLNTQPMHGYELISTIRRTFSVYFGPSTVYPLLATLEKKDYITSHWDMENDRPRKVYSLTADGNDALIFSESALNAICQKMAPFLITTGDALNSATPDVTSEPSTP